MRVLITNDDGINAPGLKLLAQIAKNYGDVIIVAPFEEQSGKSHSLNIHNPFHFRQVPDIVPGIKSYCVASTPADCVRVAHYYLKEDFDLVCSGVNNGYNLSEDIFYSGTVAAAEEGILCGKKALALSTLSCSLEGLEQSLREIFEFIFNHDLLTLNSLWNINIPLDPKGIKYTFQGQNKYLSIYHELKDDLLKASGQSKFQREGVDQFSDVACIYDGFCSLTPLSVNRTDENVFKKLIK